MSRENLSWHGFLSKGHLPSKINLKGQWHEFPCTENSFPTAKFSVFEKFLWPHFGQKKFIFSSVPSYTLFKKHNLKFKWGSALWIPVRKYTIFYNFISFKNCKSLNTQSQAPRCVCLKKKCSQKSHATALLNRKNLVYKPPFMESLHLDDCYCENPLQYLAHHWNKRCKK